MLSWSVLTDLDHAWPQVYGYQGIKSGTSSEQLVGRCLADTDAASLASPLVIGTKFFTIPWTNFLVGGGLRLGKASILEALKNSLQRVGSVDLYQVAQILTSGSQSPDGVPARTHCCCLP